MTEELKPCPFCGAHEPCKADTGVHWIRCGACTAEGAPFDTEEEASTFWNTRAAVVPAQGSADSIQQCVDYLQTELDKLDAPVTYTACKALVRHIANHLAAVPAEGADGYYRAAWLEMINVCNVLKEENTRLRTELSSPAEKTSEPVTSINQIHDALAAASLEYSAYSAPGVNVVGDRKSIDAVMSAFVSHGQIDQLKTHIRHWRDECGKLHARLNSQPDTAMKPEPRG